MKKIFLIVSLSCLAFFAKSQSFFEKYPIYFGVDWVFTMNSSPNNVNISSGNILTKSNASGFISPESQYAFNIGYIKNKYSVELSYQMLNNTIDYEFGYKKGSSPFYTTVSSPSDRYLNYVALRYYKNLHTKDRKWQLNLGGGIGIAQMEDFNLGGRSGSRGFLVDTTFATLQYEAVEQTLKKNTLCFEANFKFVRSFQYFNFQFWTRAILSSWYVRSENFKVKRVDVAEPEQTGVAKANMNSFGIGIGLQYKFSNHFTPKEKKEEEGYTYKFEVPDGFYISAGIMTTNPLGIQFPTEKNNLFGGGGVGDNQGTDFQVLLGYQLGKHSFETGLGSLTNSIGATFDPTGKWTDYEKVIGFVNKIDIIIVPMRYYFELVRLKKWHLKTGGGIVNCFIPSVDFFNQVSGVGSEERLKSYIIQGELAGKIGCDFNETWALGITAYYGFGGTRVRRLDFNKTNPTVPFYSNANAYSIGLNLQYKF
jgi:hypothetical protein